MKRKMIIAEPLPDEKHREAIRTAAEAHGSSVCFFENPVDALPELADAEIGFGKAVMLAKNAPQLRWLCTPFAGFDPFTAPGIFASPKAVLTNSSGAYGVTISEHVVMLILEILRRQPEYSEIVRRREWRRDLPVASIRGSRITLAGTGDIGCETAVRLRAFEPACLTGVNRGGRNPRELFDKIVRQEDLDSVLPETDVLVISLPGTPETFHMLNAGRLALLPDGALVINVGRGTVIDQKALESELRAGRLRAALDVFEEEPLPAGDSLWDCPNLLMAPHVAGNMTLPYTRDRIVQLFLEDFENYCAGRPLARQVDLKRGY